MAKVLFGDGVAEMRGKQGGSVYSRNTYGSYKRQKVSPVQPRTAAQLFVRTLLAAIAQSWRELDQNERDQWNLIAPTFSRTSVFGNRTPLTGFNLYASLNRMRQILGLPLITTPPVPRAVPALSTLSIAPASATQLYPIVFAPTPVDADLYIVFYASPGLSPGIKFVGSNTRVLGVAPPASTSPIAAGVDYTETFGPIVSGMKYALQGQIVHGPTGITGTLAETQALAS